MDDLQDLAGQQGRLGNVRGLQEDRALFNSHKRGHAAQDPDRQGQRDPGRHRHRLLAAQPMPQRAEWPGDVGLGVMFYGIAILLYVLSLNYTTAAQATLALATLPFLTMLVGALLRIETMDRA